MPYEPAAPDSDPELGEEVWALLTHAVADSRDQWKRAVVDRTGMAFSRIRVLRRIAQGPMTVKDLARAAAMDPPAATVTVNDLEERGLVVREIDPGNRRSKLVSITTAGQLVLAEALATPDPPPAALARLSPAELRTLRDLLRRIES
ncbi:MarR family winged helix-turn-helix transcriptional regulator [Nocardia sp. alder85J]|uniref:MarR family winged helix-turn-helix transcriptional regulator n=1 Tax=Nocardia sp. alder85J TaxID=2862949 RepID=UPI001CD5A613|nr:MarR family transcriptional regulator [Nocardia sp. alder85J]MCX4092603.1 MarR family transcriptional regulator [Nocardia sp. alder85J]